IVIAAIALTSIISNAYGTAQNPANAAMPNLQAIEPKSESGWIDMLVNGVTGFLMMVINGLATPFLNALDFFTESTPPMASNQSVLHFWLAILGIADILLILVVALGGLHVMVASALGFEEINLRNIPPRFLLIG